MEKFFFKYKPVSNKEKVILIEDVENKKFENKETYKIKTLKEFNMNFWAIGILKIYNHNYENQIFSYYEKFNVQILAQEEVDDLVLRYNENKEEDKKITSLNDLEEINLDINDKDLGHSISNSIFTSIFDELKVHRKMVERLCFSFILLVKNISATNRTNFNNDLQTFNYNLNQMLTSMNEKSKNIKKMCNDNSINLNDEFKNLLDTSVPDWEAEQ